MKCETFEGLAALRRDSRIGPAVRGCFELLWHLAGGRADYIVVTTKRIAYDFGVERRTVEGWLEKLQEYGLIEVVERDRKRGTIHVYVFHPRPDRRGPRPDPQRRLDFRPGERLGIYARETPDGQSETNVGAHKSPGEQVETNVGEHKSPAADNISRACAIDDSDDDEEISSSSSLSAVELVQGALKLQDKLYPGRLPTLSHRDKVLLVSAIIIGEAHGEKGKWWVDESIEATIEHKAEKPIKYFKSCLREGVATTLGRCHLDQTPAEFARIFLRVRPTAETKISEYRQWRNTQRAARQTAAASGQEKGAGG